MENITNNKQHKGKKNQHVPILELVLKQGVQTQSWRAGVLQSLAPTCLKTPAWKCLVCLDELFQVCYAPSVSI